MKNKHLEKLHQVLTILDNGMEAYRNPYLDNEDTIEAMRTALDDGAHLIYQLWEVEITKKQVKKRREVEDQYSW